MLTISKEANPNYLCKVVELQNIRKHTNGDFLQCVDIDFQTVITGLDAKEGDVYIYFPVECQINKDFLSSTNSFADKTLNSDPESKGYFDSKGRVKAQRFRGEKSMGYIVPIEKVIEWCGIGKSATFDRSYGWKNQIGQEFDTINNIKLVNKYVVPKKESRAKQGKKPKLSRLVEGQVHLHVDTENLRRNADKISPEDTISITYKTHGTSWWVSNVLVKRKLSWWEKVAKFLGADVDDMEYDLVYGSRRVVKNSALEDPKAKDHFFGYDLWEKIKDEVGEHIPKGYTLYGEMLGYDHNGGWIQKEFDYGCAEGEHKLEVYRITQTTPDGLVTELSYPQIAEFCGRTGLTPPHLFYYGKAGSYYGINQGNVLPFDPEKFIRALEEEFNEKDCFMCTNQVPEEGIVVRKEKLFDCESYKLKSFKFLEKESNFLDQGVTDIESEN